MQHYTMLEKIGEGTYGKVYKAAHAETGQLVAVKKNRLDMEQEGVPSTTLREVSVLQTLNGSKHIVKLLTVEHTEERKKPVLYLVFEFLPTDLKKYLEAHYKNSPMPLSLVKVLIYQLIKGVAYCHSHGLMHRDLKPSNLLIDKSDKSTPLLKIADLGLARAFSIPIKTYTHEIMTLWYRAPEVLLGTTHYAPAVDMWSVGCIFGELLTSHPLFPAASEIQELLNIFKLLGTPTEQVWKGVTRLKDWHQYPEWKPQDLSVNFPMLDGPGVDLLERLLAYQPSMRISAREALEHPFFDDVDKAAIDLVKLHVSDRSLTRAFNKGPSSVEMT